MNTEQILQQLRNERDRLTKALDALEGHGRRGRPASTKKSSGGITAAGRKKLSEMMKARWAARRAAGRTAKNASTKKK